MKQNNIEKEEPCEQKHRTKIPMTNNWMLNFFNQYEIKNLKHENYVVI